MLYIYIYIYMFMYIYIFIHINVIWFMPFAHQGIEQQKLVQLLFLFFLRLTIKSIVLLMILIGAPWVFIIVSVTLNGSK